MDIINNEQKSYNNLRLLDKLKPIKEKALLNGLKENKQIFVTFIPANVTSPAWK